MVEEMDEGNVEMENEMMQYDITAAHEIQAESSL